MQSEDTPTTATRFHPDIPDEAREFWDDVAIMAAPDDDRLAQRLFESDERITKIVIYHDGWIEPSQYDWHKCRGGVCIGKSYVYRRGKRPRPRGLPITYNRHRHGGAGPRVVSHDAYDLPIKSL